VVKGTAIVLAIYFSLHLVWNVYPLAILAFLGVLFGLAVSRAVEPIANFGIPLGRLRIRIPRGLAAGFVVLGVLVTVVGVMAWSAPTLVTEFAELRRRLPQAMRQVDQWLRSPESGVIGPLIINMSQQSPGAAAAGDTTVPIAARDPNTAAPPGQPPIQPPAESRIDQMQQGIVGPLVARVISSAQRYLFPFISSAFTMLAGMVLVIMVAIYVAADPGLYHRGTMHLVPHKYRVRTGEVLSEMAAVLRRWLRVQLIGMVVIGVATTVALYILNVPAALPLGILAGIFEFIPNVGPLISAAPAVLMGFTDGPEKALWVALTYMLIQQLESHLLVPILMQEGVDLPPVLTILAQALMAIVFGFLGLLVAVPLLAIATVAVKRLYVEGVVGDVLEDEGEPA
jgi:predicted PurR-regulated permease PerM